jgi:hypothetical protein
MTHSLVVTLVLAPLALAEPPQINGKLETVEGLRVLTVWGGDYERGFAHGYLLAGDIVSFAGRVLIDPLVVASRDVYEQKVRTGVVSAFNFDARYEQELQGLLAGIVAKLGKQGLDQKDLGRPITLEDLKAANTLADWHAFYCSSFSVWGKMEHHGKIATARNLDFYKLPGIVEQQMVMVIKPSQSGRKKWVSITWAGIIGCYTGMNEDGVTINMHDCRPGLPSQRSGFVPRSLALREAIETASAASGLSDVEQALRRQPTMFGNNIHVSTPFTGENIAAAVFEYDPNRKLDGGVTRRTAEVDTGVLSSNSVICTNHYLLRTQPIACDRYDTIRGSLLSLAMDGKGVDRSSAFGIMDQVSRRGEGILTAHTVYMLPNTRELYLSPATASQSAPTEHTWRLRLDDLLAGNKSAITRLPPAPPSDAAPRAPGSRRSQAVPGNSN